jgi:dihydroorotase
MPERIEAGAETLVPFHAGETLPWRFAGDFSG